MSRVLLAVLALAAGVAGAARLPANLEPFEAEHVCAGRAEVLVRGKTDDALTRNAQETLTKLVASLKLGGGAAYTDCPAWLSYRAHVTGDGNGNTVYAATLSLITPSLGTSALHNLKDDEFPYDGGFEFVTLWSGLGAGTATGAENLAFRLRAELVSQMDDFGSDWKAKH
ncbi:MULTISPECIES: hypothetical protein [Deinococcus]|uniref:Uncharacterized protein n=1 Tax=Deinococcus rufus TaxID=2136097 RepID=A0ABV7Z3N0_9DEIO|nr:hypothetical protein [Deinococcus sp. AB2017081]WQE95863.1 hypothetical protein U2P90_02975 [Deinococcus sp. AB2017081]